MLVSVVLFLVVASSPQEPLAVAAGGRHSSPLLTQVQAEYQHLAYAAFLGGGAPADRDLIQDVTVDVNGYTYAVGETNSTDFPVTPGAFDTSFNGYTDAFVVKINPSGTAIIFATYLGGEESDYAYGVSVDSAGNVFVSGATLSYDFPATPGAFDTTRDGRSDGFVVKFDPTGRTMRYGTFIGGMFDDWAGESAVDGGGNVYAPGHTNSPDFPVTPGAFDTHMDGSEDGYTLKLNAAGSALIYSTFLGGDNIYGDYPSALAVDPQGNAYVSGITSGFFPVTPGAFDESFNGGEYDVFLTKVNPQGSGLLYSTYLGARADDLFYGIAIDSGPGGFNAYVTGLISTGDFPVTPQAYDRTYNGGYDAFITKFNATGSGLDYSTYLGGSGDEVGDGIAVHQGLVHVSSHTTSASFPVTLNAFDRTNNGGGSDVFLTTFNRAGSALVASTFLGGNSVDYGTTVAVDRSGNPVVAGQTGSRNFPATPEAFDPSINGNGYDAFVGRFVRSATTILLSLESGPPGNVVKVRGTGFDPGKRVALTFTETASGRVTPLGEVMADPSGFFAADVQIPADPATGGSWISAQGVGLLPRRARKPFTVT